jgi:hypothetical protein
MHVRRGHLTGLPPRPLSFEAEHAPQTPLLHLSPRCTIDVDSLAFSSRACAANLLGPVVAEYLQQHHHAHSADYTRTQNANHDEVALAVPVRAFLGVLRPSRVERVRCQDTAQVSEARYECAGCSHTHLSMAGLENLVCPRHADGHCRSQPESNEQNPAIS